MNKILLIGLLILMTPFCMIGQWTQLGSAVQAEAVGDYFGSSSQINATGNVMVSGARYNEGNGYNAGHARVFDWDGSNWIQRGNDIEGAGPDDWFGYSVAIDSSGNTIAVNALIAVNANNLMSGIVRVYDWNGSDWIQRGIDLEGQGHAVTLEWYGSGLSLSDDGTILAIGGRGNHVAGGLAGFVQVYNWDGSQWAQMGNDLLGEGSHDEFGWQVSLNDAGNILAVGALGNDGFGTNQAGYVKVFQWNGSAWMQLGSKLVGEINGDEFGRSVDLNALGTVLAIGAPDYTVPSDLVSQAYVYAWDGSDWIQRGATFEGAEQINSLGNAVSLNAEGNIFAVSAPPYSSNGNVLVFEWTGATWEQIGSDIIGENLHDIFGCSIDLDDSGSILAAGAWGTSDGGQVRVFKNESIVSTNDIDLYENAIQLFPNPSSGMVRLESLDLITHVNIISLDGKVLQKLVTNSFSQDIDTQRLLNGVYILEIHSENSVQSKKLFKF